MRAMVARGDGRGRGRACRRRPRPPTSTSTTGRCRRAWPSRDELLGARRGSGPRRRGLDRVPARERDRRPRRDRRGLPHRARRRSAGCPVVIQGLGGRNKTDAPTATWEAAQSFLDRADRSRRARLLDAHRAAVRPAGRDRRDQLPLPRGAGVGPHAEAAARRARRAAARPRGTRRDARRGRALQPRSRRRARPSRRRCGTRSSSTKSREPEHAEVPVALDRARSPTSSASRPADAMLDLALAEDLATRFRWRTESPEWTAAVGEAQLDAADDHRRLRRRRAPRARRRRRLELVLPPLVGARPQGVDARGGHPPDHAGARGAASASRDRGVLAPGAPADLLVFDPETIGPWKKEFVHDLPGGVGRFKAWGQGVQATDRQRRADRARRRAHRPAARPGGAPRMTSTLDTHDLRTSTTPWVFDADGHVVEPPRVWDELLPAKFRGVRATRAPVRRPLPLRVRRPHQLPRSRAAARRWARRARRRTVTDDAGRGARRRRARPAPRRHGRRPHRRAAALYPTFGLMIQGVTEREPALALCRALNDWLAEYCVARSRAPDRRRHAADDRRRRRARRGAPLRRGARLPRRVAPARALRRAPPPAGRGVRAAVVVPRRGRRAVRASTRA